MFLISCSKESSQRPNTESSLDKYVGTYLSYTYDTAYVSVNGNYLRILLCHNGITRHYAPQFDSLVVNTTDNTFTENEILSWGGMGTYRNMGNGSFVGNKLKFNFIFQGSIQINYEGYKQ